MPRTRNALFATLLAVAATACSAAGVSTVRVRRPVSVAPSPSPAPAFEHPLTGVVFTGQQDWRSRPALAIKVENLPSARPQSGLDAADVVYEELAEGGITRFIAVFQSHGAEKVGPVRSARRVDPDVLAQFGGLFAYAGGVPPVIDAVRATPGITDVSFNRETAAYWRAPDRKAPHNLYTSTNSLWRGRRATPPVPLFAFAEPLGPPGQGASSATFSFSPSETMRYAYDPTARTYARFNGVSPHLLESGVQIAPVNVVFQIVSVGASSTVDVNGQNSPESRVLGDGEALVLSGGQVHRGRWVRSSIGAPTQFLDAAGNPIPLERGQTWVELIPAGRAIAVV
jgi:hypothetical protein